MDEICKEHTDKIDKLIKENAQADVHFKYMKDEMGEIKKSVKEIKDTLEKFINHADDRYAPKLEYEELKKQVDKTKIFVIQVTAIVGTILAILQFLGDRIFDIFK